jgi:SET and MYND domain-containing protein 4
MDRQTRKCSEKSKQFSIEGHGLAEKSKYFDAIVSYNKSLCFAVEKSSELSRGFAERSSIYFKLEKYEKCLENVLLARQFGCATEEIVRLDEIEEKCKQLMMEKNEDSENDDPWKFFKLSHEQHKKIPFIASCLKPIDTWKYGRCIVTTENMATGTIVAIEEPFFRMVNKISRYSRCAGCMKSNLGSLIPCPGKCTTSKL